MQFRGTLKHWIKQLFPPLVTEWIKRFSPRLRFAPRGWETPVPRSAGWDQEAVVAQEEAKWGAFCRNLEGPGPLGFSHEDHDLTRVRELSFHNIHLTFAYVLALTARNKEAISVLDWGGGLGHYFRLATAIVPGLALEYHCREVPAMAAAGARLNPEIRWHANDDCLERTYDLVMINGSMQYFRDWEAVLGKLARAASSYVFLTRIPVVERGSSFVAVQSSYGTRMLHLVLSQDELLRAARASGLGLLREFVIGERPFVRGAPEPCEMRGWLFAAPEGARTPPQLEPGHASR